jgi:hypothetical protein
MDRRLLQREGSRRPFQDKEVMLLFPHSDLVQILTSSTLMPLGEGRLFNMPDIRRRKTTTRRRTRTRTRGTLVMRKRMRERKMRKKKSPLTFVFFEDNIRVKEALLRDSLITPRLTPRCPSLSHPRIDRLILPPMTLSLLPRSKGVVGSVLLSSLTIKKFM